MKRACRWKIYSANPPAGNISLKLSGLGLDVDKASAIDNLRKILERAEPQDFFVRLDMESSHYTEITLEIFETLWRQGLASSIQPSRGSCILRRRNAWSTSLLSRCSSC